MNYTSMSQLLQARAESSPEFPAILALEHPPLSYAQLYEHLYSVVAQLNAWGIRRHDRVAIVLPNGPEMAVTFLSVAACATSAPLNPAYREAEFDFYLSDLEAKALIISAGMDSPAIEVATRHNIPIIELTPLTGKPAGLFTLSGGPQTATSHPEFAQPDDVALILHTSGTTSRPKMVPLRHRNICTSAANIRQSLQLTPDDRCLNIMPLFHIHGLMAAVLSSLSAGASVVCTPGFYAPQFFDWISEFKPSWYTGAPTMHQAILMRAKENQKVLEAVQLRFVRSCSASLPPQVIGELERTFNAPVIEAYGMTEASHQMTSNPLPPRLRKSGSVGVAAGPEVAIMAEDREEFLPTGDIGEIVIRGANVTSGYANNPDANASAFTRNGWFRTGDQGYLDEEGYFYISGRLKEIINRGGEKISPREIDEVLLDHPVVAQAVTFAMPDTRLGEEVAAAVILHAAAVTEKELRQFAASRLTDFKVPRRIVILDEIPKGPTGKLQRIGLAEKLGLTEESEKLSDEPEEFVAPRTEVERLLAGIWCDVLNVSEISATQRFLQAGGDSMLATQLLARVQQQLELEFSLLEFFDAPTIAEQSHLIEEKLLQELDDSVEKED